MLTKSGLDEDIKKISIWKVGTIIRFSFYWIKYYNSAKKLKKTSKGQKDYS